ncbi:MAG: prenyltransferase/squalene oxidase repeat-containing protein [Patescibacteria group bacterium]
MKKFILTIFALVIFVSPNLILADNDNTIAYLQGQSQNTWISQALAAATAGGIDISYLDYQTTDLMAASKNILTLAAVESQDTDNIRQLLSVIESSKNNGQFGSSDLLNDDFWVLMALASVNQLADTDSAKNFILDHQNTDGGWSWSASGTSDSNDTAAAIMALLDLGLDSSSTAIVNALAYLQTSQNADGGFAYDLDSSSDGASTAWVIAALNKANISASSWQKDNNDPISFLESLRQDNGSFLWMPSDGQGSTMVTAYALVALSGKAYPINYIDIAINEEVLGGHSLRIEGPAGTICLANNLEATTVLELLEAGSNVCDFEYISQDSAYGVYISAIDGVSASGMDGWQYFVDWQAGMLAVTDFILEDNQEVLWAYGGWPFYPVKLEVNDSHFEVGETLMVDFKYYNGESWLPLAGAGIVFGAETYSTDASGQFSLVLDSEGIFPIFSQPSSTYARSNKEYIVVGSGISQTVDLSVNVESDDGGGVEEDDVIAFNVDRSSINFGTLNPGQAVDTIVSLSNTGNVNIYIEASVLGDQVFTDFTSLDQDQWSDYNLDLATGSSEAVNVGLAIPSSFSALGQKQGQLIFWGINQ